jgi:hypothetical protein
MAFVADTLMRLLFRVVGELKTSVRMFRAYFP